MKDWQLPWHGGCLCGGIRFCVSAPPLLTMACHCTGCQKLSASAYSLTIAVPSEGFAVTRGEPVAGGLHSSHKQLYCPHCKNWMFTHPHGMDFFVNVRAMMLDEHNWYVPSWKSSRRKSCRGLRHRLCIVSKLNLICRDMRLWSRRSLAKGRDQADEAPTSRQARQGLPG